MEGRIAGLSKSSRLLRLRCFDQRCGAVLRADIRQSMSQLLHSLSVTARRKATSQKPKGPLAEPPERRKVQIPYDPVINVNVPGLN
jgi:hypothetical protein